MPNPVDRNDVQSLVAEGAQVAEVLPRAEYAWAHLAGAVHLPLKTLGADLAEHVLERGRPIIVYCHDYQCDMSPRAACRLEQLGYPAVHDYVPGKMDWLSFALPHEGTADLIGSHIDKDTPTCTINEAADDVSRRLRTRSGSCIALTDGGIVMGVVNLGALAGDTRPMPSWTSASPRSDPARRPAR